MVVLCLTLLVACLNALGRMNLTKKAGCQRACTVNSRRGSEKHNTRLLCKGDRWLHFSLPPASGYCVQCKGKHRMHGTPMLACSCPNTMDNILRGCLKRYDVCTCKQHVDDVCMQPTCLVV